MPSFCVVLNCSDKYGHADSISFHKFPFKRKDLLQKWTDFAQRGPGWKPTKWSSICSQHFTADDFNCVNSRKTLKKTAVPTVRMDQTDRLRTSILTSYSSKKIMSPKEIKYQSNEPIVTEQDEAEYDEGEEVPNAPQITSSPNIPKTNCRLCGLCSSAAVTFSTNFEIFGMIQKCFPTLNIQQDDNLPKDMCRVCLKRLEDFSEFIDKVLETQRSLQNKFRTDRHTKHSESRSLKIKQEPVVKVKQEVAEGFDSFLSDDLDMGMDDCCDQEPEATSVDQKFGFCDFPMLNTQDIINNCDIMEIINLDDPFIDIPDDDTACTNVSEVLPLSKTQMISAHQLLQTHMLIDEHNYACPAEDLKEEWQIKKFCKTEKTEVLEPHDGEKNSVPEVEDDYQNCAPDDTYGSAEQFKNALQNDVFTVPNTENRSSKPIVTSVSAIAESRMQFPNDSSQTSKLVVTSISDLLPGTSVDKPQKESTSKPNIVVLNESIVKSTTAFQLHACAVCQLKFFSIESLNQHVNFTHMSPVEPTIAPPMVSLPSKNISQEEGVGSVPENVGDVNKNENRKDQAGALEDTSEQNKTHNGCGVFMNDESKTLQSDSNELSQQLRNLQCWQHNMKTLQLNALINTWSHVNTGNVFPNNETIVHDSNRTPHAPCKKMDHQNQVQASVGDKIEGEKPCVNESKNDDAIEKEVTTSSNDKNKPTSKVEHCFKKPKVPPQSLRDRKSKDLSIAAKRSSFSNRLMQNKNGHNLNPPHENVLENIKFLQRRYRLLLRKCKSLEENCQILKSRPRPRRSAKCACKTCDDTFSSIYQLLQHKQRSHPARRMFTPFYATCFGCEKYFLSKLALTNHMKYICQSLSLRWFKTQMQTFKCRSCRSISFTHWRLFRNHEINCKRKANVQKDRKLRKCSYCLKEFTNAKDMESHMVLHNVSTRQNALTWNLMCTECRHKFQHVDTLVGHHSKDNCTLASPQQDCSVICCNCQQYFQQLSQLVAHRACCLGKNKQQNYKFNHASREGHVKKTQYPCNVCQKVFTSSNSLRQHRITHTHEKRHKCGLCARVFKRRGGLTQHMKGFHLQLKPYECEVCKHRYALKCDMQRCRHSSLQRRNVATDVAAASTAMGEVELQVRNEI